MHRGLLWAAGGDGSRTKYSTVPSWSWASIRFDRPFTAGMADLRFLETKEPRFSAHIESCHINLASNDVYGETLSGELIILGLCQSVNALASRSPPYFGSDVDKGLWCLQHDEDEDIRVPFTSKHTLCDIDDLCMRFDEQELRDSLQQCAFEDLQIPAGAIYLQIAKWSSDIDPKGTLYALILEPIEQPSCYRRIGRAQIPTYNGMSTIGWKLETVIII